MNKMIPIALIIGGLLLGYFGYTKLDRNTASIEIGKLEISAGDKKDSTTAYILMGLGAICLIGGIARVGVKS